MFYLGEDDLLSLEVVAAAGESEDHDTVSEDSDWVRQYRDWTDGETRTSETGSSGRR